MVEGGTQGQRAAGGIINLLFYFLFSYFMAGTDYLAAKTKIDPHSGIFVYVC